ncbi:hypothetical protein ABKN59_003984 [Abortiporus biennis]
MLNPIENTHLMLRVSSLDHNLAFDMETESSLESHSVHGPSSDTGHVKVINRLRMLSPGSVLSIPIPRRRNMSNLFNLRSRKRSRANMRPDSNSRTDSRESLLGAYPNTLHSSEISLFGSGKMENTHSAVISPQKSTSTFGRQIKPFGLLTESLAQLDADSSTSGSSTAASSPSTCSSTRSASLSSSSTSSFRSGSTQQLKAEHNPNTGLSPPPYHFKKQHFHTERGRNPSEDHLDHKPIDIANKSSSTRVDRTANSSLRLSIISQPVTSDCNSDRSSVRKQHNDSIAPSAGLWPLSEYPTGSSSKSDISDPSLLSTAQPTFWF